MKISSKANRAIAILFFVSFILTGCAGRDPSISVSSPVPSAEKPAVSSSPSVLPSSSPFILEEDWSDFFHGMNGTAIFWNSGKNEYSVHNSALALVRRSPCSTFKIVSSAVAWDIGLFASGTTTRQWSGEQFWNPEWNQDLDFPHAFRTSCVWYFREIVDEIGRERMLAALRQLQYGNCDISDWEGKQNTNNSNPALTGFWIEFPSGTGGGFRTHFRKGFPLFFQHYIPVKECHAYTGVCCRRTCLWQNRHGKESGSRCGCLVYRISRAK